LIHLLEAERREKRHVAAVLEIQSPATNLPLRDQHASISHREIKQAGFLLF
jgi:hypothetical protein